MVSVSLQVVESAARPELVVHCWSTGCVISDSKPGKILQQGSVDPARAFLLYYVGCELRGQETLLWIHGLKTILEIHITFARSLEAQEDIS